MFKPLYYYVHVYKKKSGYKIANMPWYFNITLHNRYNVVVVEILGYIDVWDVMVIGVLGDGVIGDIAGTLINKGIEAILGMRGRVWTCVTRNFSSFSGTFTC